MKNKDKVIEELLKIVERKTESWKDQCGYDIPYDYHGLKMKLEVFFLYELKEDEPTND